MIQADIYTEATLHYVSSAGTVPVDTTIFDGRTATLNWQETGFELIEMPSAVTDWQDMNQLQTIYTDETEALARLTTGCDAVLFYPPVLRNPQISQRSEDFRPIEAAHSDYAESYFDMIRDTDHPYRQVIRASQQRAGLNDTAIANSKRVLTLQFWRNTGPRFADYPLAFCDAGSVDRAQMMEVIVEQYGGLRTEFESLLLLAGDHTRQHQWFTFPGLTDSEAVMFRAFDSDRCTAGETYWSPHCAFADPQAGPNPLARESVEMRAICLFL